MPEQSIARCRPPHGCGAAPEHPPCDPSPAGHAVRLVVGDRQCRFELNLTARQWREACSGASLHLTVFGGGSTIVRWTIDRHQVHVTDGTRGWLGPLRRARTINSIHEQGAARIGNAGHPMAA